MYKAVMAVVIATTALLYLQIGTVSAQSYVSTTGGCQHLGGTLEPPVYNGGLAGYEQYQCTTTGHTDVERIMIQAQAGQPGVLTVDIVNQISYYPNPGVYYADSQHNTNPFPTGYRIVENLSSTVTQPWAVVSVNGSSAGDGTGSTILAVKLSWVGIVPTDTPVPTSTATDTSTPTATSTVPTVTSTITPGGPTLTFTSTPTGTATAVPTSTPASNQLDCGEATFPLLNCNFVPGGAPVLASNEWSFSGNWQNTLLWTGASNRPAGSEDGYYNGVSFGQAYDYAEVIVGATSSGAENQGQAMASQSVTVPAAGALYLTYDNFGGVGYNWTFRIDGTNVCTTSGAATTLNCGHVSAGSHTFGIWFGSGIYGWVYQWIRITDVKITTDLPWTPAPTATTVPSSTPTWDTRTPQPTSTPQNTPGPGTPTWTPTVTNTPYPDLFATATSLPTLMPLNTVTPCPTGCMSITLPLTPTAIIPDTGWLDRIKVLSVTRPSCIPICNLPLMVPVPTYDTGPISYTVTLSSTGAIERWRLANGTTIDPCHQFTGDGTIWWGWDLLYWAQIVAIGVGYLLYQVRFLGRIFR